MDNASGTKPEVDRAAYDRYKALMQRKFDESAHTTNYAAKYKALKDAKDAREIARAVKARQHMGPAHPHDTTATSDSDDPNIALQALNPRKQFL